MAGRSSRALAVAALAAIASAHAQGTLSVEKMGFKLADAFEPGAAVSGELRIPESKRERLPAVLILHGSAGVDGRGASYAKVLNEAGIATLEIDMFQGRGRPATTRHNMPHAYESLRYLAAHPRIDAERIGVMGFSWGGIMSVLTSSAELTQQYTGGKPRFAAHLGLYPVCWTHRSVVAGQAKYFKPSVYRQVTGSPVRLLAGDKDDYDEPGACGRFLSELAPEVRAHFSLTVYAGATHGWDGVAGGAYYDIGANSGKGGSVDVIADARIARQSREFAVAFFTKALGERP